MEDTLRRDTRIKVFPIVAVTDRIMLRVDKKAYATTSEDGFAGSGSIEQFLIFSLFSQPPLLGDFTNISGTCELINKAAKLGLELDHITCR